MNRYDDDTPTPQLQSCDFTDHETRQLQRVATWVDEWDTWTRWARRFGRVARWVGRHLRSVTRMLPGALKWAGSVATLAIIGEKVGWVDLTVFGEKLRIVIEALS